MFVGNYLPLYLDSAMKLEPASHLSQRGSHAANYGDFIMTYFKEALKNPYHPKLNPKGIINMGTAINRLMETELAARITQGDALAYTPAHQHYYELSGTAQLRQALAGFFTRHFCPGRNVSPDNLVVMNGVGACLDSLGHALCDPGDVLLTPTPVYGRIFTDFCDRSLVCVEPIDTSQETNVDGMTFDLRPEDVEERIVQLTSEGKRVRGLVLLHPHNPLGTSYSPELLRKIFAVCARHQMHVIVDEIYALSVFDTSAPHQSVLSLDDLPDPEKTHVLWGLTKDFALAGFRVGVIHTQSKELLQCLRAVSTYQCTPHLIQHAAATLLNDIEWCDNFYLPTNQRRMQEAYTKALKRLEGMGVKVRRSQAGFFVWANLQSFLCPCTEEEELKLFDELFESGLFLVPGSKLYCVNPGWFRFIFTIAPEDLDEALNKVELVLCRRRTPRKHRPVAL